MRKEDIRELALANGFKLKEQPDGTLDLNPYVYDFARAILGSAVSSNRQLKRSPYRDGDWFESCKPDDHD